MAELVVFSSLFPSTVRPGAGLFIRERMFRVARHRSLVVVSPQAWFPGQGLIRRFRPGYRPAAPAMEIQQGITDLLMEVVGPFALPFTDEDETGSNALPIGPDYAGPLAPNYFNYRKVSIYGGSNEIQKNIIAKAILGL